MGNDMKKSFFLIVLFIFFSTSLCSCEKVQKDLKVYWWAKEARDAHDEGNYDKAIELYKKIIELAPDDAVAYWDLGIAYLDMDDEKNARK